MLRAARSLLAMRHPLDAELVVSELLGSWWGQRVPGVDVERVLGEGLVSYAAGTGSPAGLALLAGISALGTSERQRRLATEAVTELIGHGVAGPSWAASVGRVRPLECHVSGSLFGDTDEIVCTFRSDIDAAAGEQTAEHALIAVVDHNAGGVLRDVWVTTKVERLLAHCRDEAEANPMATFETVTPERARGLLEAALERTESLVNGGDRPARLPGGGDGLTGGSLAAHRALLSARVRALPRPQKPVGIPSWRRDRRAVLAARFLASDAAAELSDSYAASRCVDHIIDYGCDVDFGRPLRVSPRKVEAFLLSWLPRRVVLLPAEQEAMPHVLAAWIRWAGPRGGLPEIAVGATLDAVWESTAAFTRSYRDPSSFGLRHDAVRRLLPDGDLSALPRRMFAFPLLASDLVWEETGLDPSTAEGRRALLRLDLFGEYGDGSGGRGRHSAPEEPAPRLQHPEVPEPEETLAAHERLAERLWHGDPPALWNAAQRLLDRGHSRSAVLETLLDVLGETGDGEDLDERLDDL
ncbi:hypothetical protein ACQEU5_16115 [Marinactinospora thermotolerans]|uniref:Uncharacterized protein n=1 Tax=Marinactinospora thermotolerans DSM 45154 TaxID=1122192 RepID=A0A1T4SMW8_9ACTN|nr:hypothetical protein [Marinactinospora thermotolerans]SKA29486.1 hypothetical protein SAMN02745673_03722 [Marinactinospora thermotolerans DSM 45154]